jgi:inward rectifier potassium channel
LPAAARRPKLRAVARPPPRFRPPGADYEIRIVGSRSSLLRDFYHALLQKPWWVTIASISTVFVVANALFALVYLETGGIAHAVPGSFCDAFFFSVQTMGTIGYGWLYPESRLANVLVVIEAITGLTLTALATGLVFAKFSRSTARLLFTSEAVISPVNGVPTLMFRVGNRRGNELVDVQIRVGLVRTEHPLEGGVFYRMLDLKLQRDRALSLSRSFSVQHPIDEASPLWGRSPQDFIAEESELQIMVVGLDDVTMQTVHAGHRYFTRQVIWGARHADILCEAPDGVLELNLERINVWEPTPPTDRFPYSAAAKQS